jgi:outer membrane protein
MTSRSFLLLLVATVPAMSQGKIGYVDFQYILSQVQAATDVQSELQRLAAEWTEEIESLQDSLATMEKDMETISLALSKSSRDMLEKNITERRQRIAALREKRFSPVNGDLYKKQQELLQPVIDKIKKAIDNVRIRQKYDVLFDISAGNPVSIDKKLDLTVDVIDELPAVGLTVRTTQIQQQEQIQQEEQVSQRGRTQGGRKTGKEESKKKESQVETKEEIDN